MEIIEDFIRVNEYSRPQKECKPKSFVLHWPEWPGMSAKRLRDYFDSLADQPENLKKRIWASTQFTCGWDGVYQLMLLDEEAHHSNSADTGNYTNFAWQNYKEQYIYPWPSKFCLGVEVSHKDWSGKWGLKTMNNLIDLCVYVCREFDWDPESENRIVTHNMITGKYCPKWLVDNPDELERIRQATKTRMIMDNYRKYRRWRDYYDEVI